MRILLGFLTASLASFVWMCVTVGGMGTIVEHLSHLSSSNTEYYLDKLLVGFSTVEYLAVFLIGAALLAFPWLLRDKSLRRNGKKRVAFELLGSLLLLLLFAFTLLFFLPQYGIYDTVPFRYVFI